MAVKDVAVGVIGFVVGVGVGYILKQTTPAVIPSYIMEQLNRHRFYDVDAGKDMQGPQFMWQGSEGDWDEWIVGYGHPPAMEDDILVSVGHNRVTGEVSGVITKLCWNSVTVYLDNVEYTTFPRYTGFDTNYLGVRLVYWKAGA